MPAHRQLQGKGNNGYDSANTKKLSSMSNSPSQRLFGTTNELAKERNRAAAERTMNSWIGSCLGLVGAGVAIDQIDQSLRRRYPDASYAMAENVAHIVGLTFVGAGIVLLGLALIQHRLEIKTIEREDYVLLSIKTLNRVVAAAIILAGILGFLTILFLL
jgi:putative membrane protein